VINEKSSEEIQRIFCFIQITSVGAKCFRLLSAKFSEANFAESFLEAFSFGVFFFSKEAKTYFLKDQKVSKKSFAKRSCRPALPK